MLNLINTGLPNSKASGIYKSGFNKMKQISFELLFRFFNGDTNKDTNPYFSYVKITGIYSKKRILKCFLNEALCVGCVLKGEAIIECDKTHYEMNRGTGFFDKGGTVIEIKYVSDDFEMLLIYVSEQIKLNIVSLMEERYGGLFHLVPIIQMDNARLDIFISTMNLLDKVHTYRACSPQTVTSACTFILELFRNFSRQNSLENVQNIKNDNQNTNYQYEVYGRFLKLCHIHSFKERSVYFYADKLYVTPRTLGCIVKEFSGRSAKEWIDKSAIMNAKILLAHSSKNIMQISEELNFASLSAFTIFFKRMTGQTPLEYRKEVCSKS